MPTFHKINKIIYTNHFRLKAGMVYMQTTLPTKDRMGAQKYLHMINGLMVLQQSVAYLADASDRKWLHCLQ